MTTLTIPKAILLSLSAWMDALRYLFVDSMIAHKTISKWVYRGMGLFSLIGIGKLAIKKRLGTCSVLLIAFLLLIMPLGGNCVYVLSLGFKHSLMKYSFVFFSVLAVMIFDMMETGAAGTFLRRAIPVLCAVLLLNHVLFANQWYIRTDLYTKAGMSFMTRLVNDMEDVEGYEVGITPVLILGHIDESPASYLNEDYEIADDPYVGTTHHLAISYYGTYSNYFENVLGYPADLVPLSEVAGYLDDPRIQAMPIYPAHGSIQMIDGVLVVRLSEDLRPEEMKWN